MSPTKTTAELEAKTRPTTWAAELGANTAARRAQREAEQRAEAEAAGARRAVPTELLRRRFAAVVEAVLEAVDAFAVAAEVRIDVEPASATQIELRACDGEERLRLTLADEDLVVMIRGRSRSEERSIDVSVDAFTPAAVALAIDQDWIHRIALHEGGPHHA
jgi:hypothetical protein